MTTSMIRPRWGALALTIVLALLAAAVLRNGEAAGDAGATASAVKTVQIKNFAFHPGTLNVRRGARVTFVNASGVAHTATKGGSFDTKTIEPGKSATVKFGKRGTFAYHCKIHPFMKGKVIVE